MKQLQVARLQEQFTLSLPKVIVDLVIARQAVRDHYRPVHGNRLLFTFDGNLVGDIGEALAVEYFQIELNRPCGEGSDGLAPDGTTVQVKATGTGRGAAFRDTELHAHRLLFFNIDFAHCCASVIYNGLEAPVRAKLSPPWQGQKSLSMAQMRELDGSVRAEDRLPCLPSVRPLRNAPTEPIGDPK
jgi:hypothetical protein